MHRLVVLDHISLDGVMQAPGRPDEDRRGGFEYGGWALPDNDEVMGTVMAKGMAQAGPLLFGRRTYEDFAGYWPNQTDNPFTGMLDNAQKYVVSTTLRDPLPWKNSTLINEDVPAAVAKLKQQSDGDIVIMGSGVLIQSLMPHGLIDTYTLMIHPIVLGTGRRLFADGAARYALRLVESVTTTTGVVIATYEPA